MFGFESSVIAEYWPLFVHGAWTTVQVTIICVCLGMCLGTLLGMGRLAQARYNPLKGFLHYCVRWPIGLRELLSRHAALCADFSHVLCRAAGLYSPG